MRRALFPGTFDPYTIGHDSIVRRALTFMDEIVISVVDCNISKNTLFPLEKRVNMIKQVYKDERSIKVMSYSNLTVDFAKEVGAEFIIRGVRTVTDFEYEQNMAEVNKRQSGIETILLFTEPELAYVTSTNVREMLAFGKDVSEFLPKGLKLE